MGKLQLNDRDVAQLEIVIRTTDDVRQLQRAQALLWLSEGDSASEIAERLRVDRRTVYNWVARFEQRSEDELTARIADGVRGGRPPRAKGVIDQLIDLVIDSDPRDFGYRQTVWTAALLRTYLRERHRLTVSRMSVARAIDRLGIIWKRPRYILASRDPHWRQAKGGSNAASGKTRGQSS
jgi:transposase